MIRATGSRRSEGAPAVRTNGDGEMDFNQRVEALLRGSNVTENPTRQNLIRAAAERGEAIVSANGALATWTPPESTGRSPSDTLTVRRESSQDTIDWDSPNNIPVDEETFDMALAPT